MIQNLTSVSYTTSDQYKEASCSTKERVLKSENTESQGNIATGITAWFQGQC